MRIESVRLVNIRSYADQQITFHSGVNFISGCNGAGKTTIIEAIGWALFGAQPPGTIEDNLRYGTKKGEIHVRFSANGERFLVKRLIGTANSRRLYDADGAELNLHGEADSNSFIKNLLGLSADEDLAALFADVIGVRQGTFTLPFLEAPGERKRIFNKVLRLDSYARAERNSGELKEHIREKLNELDLQFVRDDQIASEEEGVAAALRETQTQIASLLRDSSRLCDEQRAVQALADAHARAKNIAQDAQKAYERAQQTLQSAQKEAQAKQAEREDARRANERLDALRGDYDAYQAAQESQAALEERRKIRDGLAGEKAALESAIAVEEKAIAVEAKNNEDAYARAEQAAVEAQALRGQLEKKSAELQTLAQSQAYEQKTLQAEKEQQGSLEDAQRKLNEYSASLLRGIAKYEEIEMRSSEAKALLDRAEEITSRLARMEAAIATENIAAARVVAAEQRVQKLLADQARFQSGSCPYTDAPCPTVASLEEQTEKDILQIRKEIDELAQKVLEAKEEQRACAGVREEKTRLDDARTKTEKLRRDEGEYIAGFRRLFSLTRDIAASGERFCALMREMDGLSGGFSLAGLHDVETAMERAKKEAEQKIASVRDDLAVREKDLAARIAQRTADEAHNAQEQIHCEQNAAAATADRMASERKRDELALRREALLSRQKNKQRIETQLVPFAELEGELEAVRGILLQNEEHYREYVGQSTLASRLESLEIDCEALRIAAENAREDAQRKAQAHADAQNAYKPEEEAAVQEKLRDIGHMLAEKNGRLQILREQESERQQKLQAIAEAKARKEETGRKIQAMQKSQELLKHCLFVLKNAGERMAEKYRERLSVEADKLYRAMSAEAATLQWTDDYDIRLVDTHDSRERRRVFRQLSGGEQMTAALALRLALLTQLSGAGIAFFDEPTTNLDAQRRKLLSDVLPKVTGSFEQIFVVSHDDTFDAMSENVIELRRGQNGTQVAQSA